MSTTDSPYLGTPHPAVASDPATARLEAALLHLRFEREPDEVARAVRRLDPDVVRAAPLLRLLAIDAGVLTWSEAWSLVEPALDRVRSSGPHGRDAALTFAASALLHAAERRPAAARRRVEELVDAVGDGPREPESARGVALALALAGSAALLAGDLTVARSSLEGARVQTGRVGSGLAPLRRHLAADLALVAALTGDLRTADDLLVEVLDAAERGVSLPRRTADATQLTQLLLLIDRGAMALAERSVRARPPGSYGVLWPVALRAHADHLLLSGRAEHGLRVLQASVRSAEDSWEEQDGLASRLVRVVRGELLLATGDLRAAAAVLDPGGVGPGAAPALATVLWASGEFEAAGYVARTFGPDAAGPRDRGRLLGVEAAVALVSGDADLAQGRIARILEAADAQRWRTCAAHLPEPVRRGLERAASPVAPWAPWVPAPALSAPLSPRERLVLRLLVEGITRAEVAARLGVSLNTVKTQTRRLYAKLGVTSRAQAVAKVAMLPDGSQLTVRV